MVDAISDRLAPWGHIIPGLSDDFQMPRIPPVLRVFLNVKPFYLGW